MNLKMDNLNKVKQMIWFSTVIVYAMSIATGLFARTVIECSQITLEQLQSTPFFYILGMGFIAAVVIAIDLFARKVSDIERIKNAAMGLSVIFSPLLYIKYDYYKLFLKSLSAYEFLLVLAVAAWLIAHLQIKKAAVVVSGEL